jgi:hypothetical protein
MHLTIDDINIYLSPMHRLGARVHQQCMLTTQLHASRRVHSSLYASTGLRATRREAMQAPTNA